MKALNLKCVVKKKRPQLNYFEIYRPQDIKHIKLEKDEVLIDCTLAPRKPKTPPRTNKN